MPLLSMPKKKSTPSKHDSGSNISPTFRFRAINGSGSNSTQQSFSPDAMMKPSSVPQPPQQSRHSSAFKEPSRFAKSLLQRTGREENGHSSRSRSSSPEYTMSIKQQQRRSVLSSPNPNSNSNDLAQPVLIPEMTYSKTLAGLGRPMSRVASAFIADIHSGNNNSNGKRKSQVTFGENQDAVTRPPQSSSRRASRMKIPPAVVVNRSRRPNNGASSEKGHHDQYDHHREEDNMSQKSDSQKSDILDNDSVPPIDPTENVAGFRRRRAATPYHHHHHGHHSDQCALGEEKGAAGGGENKESSPSSSSSSCISTTHLQVTGLPLHTTIDDMKQLFHKARSIKLVLIRDNLNRYKRNAVIEFVSTRHARQGYERAKHVRIFGDSTIKLDFTADDIEARINKDVENQSDGTIEDLLPNDTVDKESMVREWINVQRDYVNASRKSRSSLLKK